METNTLIMNITPDSELYFTKKKEEILMTKHDSY